MRNLNMVLRLLAVALLAVGLFSTAGCKGTFRPAADLPDPVGLSENTTETVLYFSTGRTLLGEVRLVNADDPYEDAFRQLLEATPESNPDVAIVQPEAEFYSVTLKDGIITVDWAPEVLDFEAEPAEKRIAFASILATFGVFPEVEKVRFTVDGQDTGEINGKDIVAFWGDVSLNGQPFDVLRVKLPSESEESSETTTPM